MGCDIHVHAEIKIDEIWHHYSSPDVERNYELFEKMAGVRGDLENAIIKPRGVPRDITFLTLLDFERWDYDMHSASWFGVEEIKELEEWFESTRYEIPQRWLEHHFGYLFGNAWRPKKYPTFEIEDVRFVFWFDN